ncbi:beta-1,4-galactosyltransferase 2-like [Rhopilema esculentum]|uniref:beta-1,4-galactosyltransferase 2-like n=1 Tax=Rhopilema esculentum TaxID=499914 RepID=UPI0031D51308|eukprot:gene17165-8707_t
MEYLQNKELRKLLIFTVLLGFVFGCFYIFTLENYFTNKSSINLEILQNFEIFKDFIRYNSTDLLNNEKVKESSAIININQDQETIIQNFTLDVKTEEVRREERNKQPTQSSKLSKALYPKTDAQRENVTKSRSKHALCRVDKSTLGPIYVDDHPVDILTLSEGELHFVKQGGQWEPADCKPRAELAVVIPFRKRDAHLAMFSRHMHKFLRKQKIKYRIFVIEQDDEYEFNRGKLLNIGFKEALSRHPFTCFAFHDIDLLPEDTRNDYACPSSPRHVSVAIDKFGYELIYPELFGGIEMFRTEDFKMVNGFSNSFWGWGAEDDNLYFRIMTHNLQLTRPSMTVGRYKMLKHLDMEVWGAPNRRDILKKSKNIKYIGTDGLSSLQYKVNRVLELPLFTVVKVNLQMHKDRLLGVHDYF